jgi:hypothetical protein
MYVHTYILTYLYMEQAVLFTLPPPPPPPPEICVLQAYAVLLPSAGPFSGGSYITERLESGTGSSATEPDRLYLVSILSRLPFKAVVAVAL